MFTGMKTHAEIVRDCGAAALARLLTEDGSAVQAATAQRWAERDSIPGEYWMALARLKVASLNDLAAAAATRRNAPQTAEAA